MKGVARRCFLLAMLSLLVGGSAFSQAASSSLRLTVRSDRRIYAQGETIGLTVSLKNTGDRELSLFHPPMLGEGWWDWELSARVKKPGGRVVTIKPALVTARVPLPEESHFRALIPGESIDFRMLFPGKGREGTSGAGEWVAMLPLTRFEAERFPEWLLRWKYRIKGEFGYLSDGGGREYIQLYDIVGDVFGHIGRYTLEISYVNRYDFFLAPDATEKYLVPKKAPRAWIGELSQTISFSICQYLSPNE